MRIMDRGAIVETWRAGDATAERDRFEHAIQRPTVRCSSPGHGSGKSTTSTRPARLNDGERSILTIEDPASSGSRHQADADRPKAASPSTSPALDAARRPDVIMSGRSATRRRHIAVEAALTGTSCSPRYTRATPQRAWSTDRHGHRAVLVSSAVDCIVAQRCQMLATTAAPAEGLRAVLAEHGLSGAERLSRRLLALLELGYGRVACMRSCR